MKRPLRVVFGGTPDFAVPCLRSCLRSGVEMVAAYTQPERPAGRGRKATPSPVKQAALAVGIAVRQPLSLKDAEVQAALAALEPDLMVVVAYGLILPPAVLTIPALGCWNLHASLLPRWRGAAPIQRAILAGDAQTGVNLMQMQAGLDTGPVLLEARTAIAAQETGGSLHQRLSALAAELLAEGLERTLAGASLIAMPQPDEGVSYAHKLHKAEARLDFTRPASTLERMVRAFNPWPVAEGEVAGERLRIWAAHTVAGTGTPGEVIGGDRDGLIVACGEAALCLTQVQRAGGRRIGIADYLNARPELRRAVL